MAAVYDLFRPSERKQPWRLAAACALRCGLAACGPVAATVRPVNVRDLERSTERKHEVCRH